MSSWTAAGLYAAMAGIILFPDLLRALSSDAAIGRWFSKENKYKAIYVAHLVLVVVLFFMIYLADSQI